MHNNFHAKALITQQQHSLELIIPMHRLSTLLSTLKSSVVFNI